MAAIRIAATTMAIIATHAFASVTANLKPCGRGNPKKGLGVPDFAYNLTRKYQDITLTQHQNIYIS